MSVAGKRVMQVEGAISQEMSALMAMECRQLA
jgi:hypothetical protein